MVNSGQSPGVEVVFHSAEITNSDVFSLSTWESSGKVGLRTNGTNPMKQNPLRNGATTTGVASTASTHVTCHQQNRISRLLSINLLPRKGDDIGLLLTKEPRIVRFRRLGSVHGSHERGRIGPLAHGRELLLAEGAFPAGDLERYDHTL
jgi:hypothetical protein